MTMTTYEQDVINGYQQGIYTRDETITRLTAPEYRGEAGCELSADCAKILDN